MTQNEGQTMMAMHVLVLIPAVLWGMLVGHIAGGWIGRLLTTGAGVAGGEIGGAIVGGLMTGGMILAAMNRVSHRPQTLAWRITLILLGGLVVGGCWGLIGGGLGALIEIGNVISAPGAILMVIGILGALSALRMLVKK